mgnify:CR=1 FL=1
MVDVLLAAGADPNAANDKGMVPIGAATQVGALRVCERLVAAGADLGGFRAVLWQQGESDVIAKTSTETYVANVRAAFEKAAQAGETPVLLTSPTIRPFVRSLIERFRPSTAVLGQSEVHAKVRLKAMGQV